MQSLLLLNKLNVVAISSIANRSFPYNPQPPKVQLYVEERVVDMVNHGQLMITLITH